MTAWREGGDGLLLDIRVTPRGGRDAIEGPRQLADGRTVLALRVASVAEDGAATAAAIRLVAKAAGIPPSAVSLASGRTARVKRLNLAGDAQALAIRLEQMIKDRNQ